MSSLITRIIIKCSGDMDRMGINRWFLWLFIIAVSLVSFFYFAITIAGFYVFKAPSSMVRAASAGDIQTIKRLSMFGVDPNRSAFLGGSPLNNAAASGRLDAMQELLRIKADINNIDGYGVAAIHCAVRYKREKAIQFLIRNRCDINLRSREGQTALDIALDIDDNHQIIDILKANGAKTAKELPVFAK